MTAIALTASILAVLGLAAYLALHKLDDDSEDDDNG